VLKKKGKIMFKGIKTGTAVVKNATELLIKRPKLLFPLLFSWMLYAPLIIYFNYYFNGDNYKFLITLSIYFILFFIFAFITSISNLILLELIYLLKSGKKVKLFTALKRVILYDLYKSMPVIVIWAVIWFIIEIISAMFSSDDKKDKTANAKNFTKTLSGYGETSIFSLGFEIIQKFIRMGVFLILPAIVWENLSIKYAYKNCLNILKDHSSHFTWGIILTKMVDYIVFLPVGILYVVSDEFNITLPDIVWIVALIYCSFAWSYSEFIEQIYCAELYLWNLKLLRERERAIIKESVMPVSLSEIIRPSLLNNDPDLLLLEGDKDIYIKQYNY
jgi:hypothetical protein